MPTLSLLSAAGEAGLTTTEIKESLMSSVELSEDDQKILAGRNDSHFSQQVRNLVSHSTLAKKGLAEFEPGRPSGRFRITELGRVYLGDHAGDFDYLVESGFSDEQRRQVIESDFKDLIIEEGHYVPSGQNQKRKRSRRLTQLARKYYMRDNKIWCAGCNFNFDDFYGKHAAGYIEIHHLKPIHTYDTKDMEQGLDRALQNLSPLCSNCHRMVHRDSRALLGIPELRDLVIHNGVFKVVSKSED